MKYIFALSVLLILNSCGITSPQDVGHAHKFTLNTLPLAQQKNVNFGNLIIDFPKASAELDTYRIAVLRDKNKRDYYAGARWADFLPTIVQATLVKSLQNSNHFTHVAPDHAQIIAPHRLASNIQEFHVDYTNKDATVLSIKMHFTVIDTITQKTVKHFTLSKKETITNEQLSEIAKLFSTSFTHIQQHLIKKLDKALATKG